MFDFFPMLHHEEFPEKPQFDNPPFLEKLPPPPSFCLILPPFLAKFFNFMKGGKGFELCAPQLIT